MSIDAGMGIALGVFRPQPAYEEIRPIFRLFTQAMIAHDAQEPYDDILKAYYRKRDELHLSFETDDGLAIPSECIHIVDLSSETGDYEIEIKFSGRADIENLSREVAAANS